MPIAIVSGVDRYCWVTPDGSYTISDRGDTIDVTDEEFARIPGALSLATDAPAEVVEAAVEAELDAVEAAPAKPAKTK